MVPQVTTQISQEKNALAESQPKPVPPCQCRKFQLEDEDQGSGATPSQASSDGAGPLPHPRPGSGGAAGAGGWAPLKKGTQWSWVASHPTYRPHRKEMAKVSGPAPIAFSQ